MQPCAGGAFTDPPRDTTSFTLTLYDTMMPKISLLAPSFNLHTTHQSEVGADKHSFSRYMLPRHTAVSVWRWGETHSVLEARLVSSCFSFPSSARPRFSRLLARNGVSVKTLQKVELGATTSLQKESGRLIRHMWEELEGRVGRGRTHSDSSVATGHLY